MLPWSEREKKVFIKLAQWINSKNGPKLAHAPPAVAVPPPAFEVRAAPPAAPPPPFWGAPPPDMDLLSRRVLSMGLTSKSTAFISYCWGQGDENHPRVRQFAHFLTTQGINVWLDEEQMGHGDVKERAVHGMNESACFIAVLTDEYINKVNSKTSTACKDEIKYWHDIHKDPQDKTVYVIMDTNVLNAQGTINVEKYKGLFLLYYGKKVFFNIAPEHNDREAAMYKIAYCVKKIMGEAQ